jgi:hypothetical protein
LTRYCACLLFCNFWTNGIKMIEFGVIFIFQYIYIYIFYLFIYLFSPLGFMVYGRSYLKCHDNYSIKHNWTWAILKQFKPCGGHQW